MQPKELVRYPVLAPHFTGLACSGVGAGSAHRFAISPLDNIAKLVVHVIWSNLKWGRRLAQETGTRLGSGQILL